MTIPPLLTVHYISIEVPCASPISIQYMSSTVLLLKYDLRKELEPEQDIFTFAVHKGSQDNIAGTVTGLAIREIVIRFPTGTQDEPYLLKAS